MSRDIDLFELGMCALGVGLGIMFTLIGIAVIIDTIVGG